MRWGITLPMTGLSLPDHRDLVAGLTDWGYTDIWSAETAGVDAFTPLALAAQWNPEVRLGPAIVPVYTRGPALIAQQAATVAGLAPGRFMLGIGSSSPAIVQSWNGIAFDEPFKRTRDTLRFLREALTGEKVTATYDTFSIKGFRLDNAPAERVPIALAALRPGMLRLAAAEADAAITNWLGYEDVAKVRSVVGPDLELLARIFVIPTEDAEAARKIGRFMISSYLTVPVYAKFHEWLGNGPQLAKTLELWQAGDRKAANAAVPDELVDRLIIHGTPEQCVAHVRRYVDAGLTTPILAVVQPGPDPAATLRSLSPIGG